MSAFICFLLIHMIAISFSLDEIILSKSTSQDTFNFFQLNSNGTVEVKVEYDMMLSIEQYKALTSRPKDQRAKRATAVNAVSLWPGGKVYYTFEDNVQHLKQVIMSGISIYQQYTCLEFIESSHAFNRIRFMDCLGCLSYLGMQNRFQYVCLGGSLCSGLQGVLHEIGHSIGLLHEHSRPDRDYYVYIQAQYRATEFYLKWDIDKVNSFGMEYDYTSVMHYKRIPPVITLDPAYQSQLGTLNGLSFKDIKTVNLLYQCRINGGCPPKTCRFNGFVLYKPFRNMPKCSCWCDSGTVTDPLVPCCQIDREVPRPNIPPRSSNSELNLTTCNDLRDNCATLKEKGMCCTKFKMMYKECTKTCNFCGKGDNLCMDYEDGCHIMAGSGACKEEGLEEIMSKLCKKSCGLCRTVATPCDIEEAFCEEFKDE